MAISGWRFQLQEPEAQPEIAAPSKPGSIAESLRSANLCFGGFLFPVLWWRVGLHRPQQPLGNASDLLDGRPKRGFVGLGWLREAADLPDELQGSRAHFLRGHRRIEIEQR